VVLVRPAEAGWETYLLRRSAQSPVLADLWVFPGGTLRADDLVSEVERLYGQGSPDRGQALLSRESSGSPPAPIESLAYFAAAAREVFEEAGVVLGGLTAHPSLEELADLRAAVERGRAFHEVASELGAMPSLDDFVYYAHWITPEALPQRFDTRFFLARMPGEQEASPSPYEMAEGIWTTAETALERAKTRDLPLHFATLNHLRRLASYKAIDELFDFARTKPVPPVMPNTRERDGRIMPYLPSELEGVW